MKIGGIGKTLKMMAALMGLAAAAPTGQLAANNMPGIHQQDRATNEAAEEYKREYARKRLGGPEFGTPLPVRDPFWWKQFKPKNQRQKRKAVRQNAGWRNHPYLKK